MADEGQPLMVFPQRRSLPWSVLWIAIVALIYFGVARFSFGLVFEPSGIAAIWPPSGVFLCALLLTRRELRPWLAGVLFVSDFIAEMLAGTPLAVSLIYALVLTGDAVFSVWLLRRFVGEPITFGRVREVVAWLVLSVVFSNALASLVSASASSQLLAGTSFWDSFRAWMASDGVGNLVVTPLILSWVAWGRTRPRAIVPKRALEAAALFVLFALSNYFVFDRLSEWESGLLSLLLIYATFPFLLWAALRFEVRGVASIIVPLPVIAVYFASNGLLSSFLVSSSSLDAVIMVQLLVIITALPALFLASLTTERRQADKALAEQSKFVSAVVDTVPSAVYVVDMDTASNVYSNGGVEEILGYTAEEIQEMGSDLLPRLIHPDDLADVIAFHGQVAAAADGEVLATEYRMKSAGGQWTHLHSYESPFLRDEDGSLRQKIGIAVDISERKQAEGRLREAQVVARLGSYDLDIPAGTWTSSDMMDVLFGIDQAYERSTQGWLTLVHPDDRAMMSDYFEGEVIARGRAFDKEYRFIRRNDGAERWAHGLGRLEFDDRGRPVRMLGTIQDITERKQAENALLTSESRYRELYEQSPLGYQSLDAQGCFLTVNQAWLDLLGYDEDEVIGQWFGDFLASDMIDLFRENFPRFIAAGETRVEFDMKKKDGSVITVAFAGRIGYDEKEHFKQTHCVLSDITKRKQAETYKELGREILQVLNEPGDLRDSIRRVVAALKTRTGSDAVGIRLQDGDDFPYFRQEGFSPDFLLTENSLVERAVDGGLCRDRDGNVSLECTCGLVISGKTDPGNPLFTPGGSAWTNDSFPILDIPAGEDPRRHPRNKCIHQGYASIALVPIRSKDRVVGLIQLNDRRKGRFSLETVELLEGIAAHIGSALMRKQAEEAVRDSEERFRTMSEVMSDTVFITDSHGVIVYLSPAAREMFGFDIPEMEGRHFAELLADDYVGTAMAVFGETVASGGLTRNLELGMKRKDGSIFFGEVSGSLYKTRGFTGTTGAIGDITERKEAEAALRESEERLRQSQKMEAVGQLAGGIAHDFNNLLTAILGYSDLVLLDGSSTVDEVRPDLEEIKRAGERARVLTQQILAFSRRQALRPETVFVRTVVKGLEPLLRRTVGEDIDLQITESPGMAPAEVDPHQLEQVILNLVINARDAMPSGGRLTVETATVELGEEFCLTHAGAVPGSYVMLRVSDTGVGMDPSTKERIFEPFFTTKAVGAGTGLGLSTVYGIVKQSGGTIFVTSEPGRGSSFAVYLPQAAHLDILDEVPIPPHVSARGHETIVVVEDEKALQGLIERILGAAGYRTISFSSAPEALAGLEQGEHVVDLLLTDVMLPGPVQGHDLARTVLALRPHLPVLYISGYARDALVHAGRLDEGVNLLEKPFTPKSLTDKVREVLDQSQGSG